MNKKTKKILSMVLGIVIFLALLYFELPKVVNSEKILTVSSENITLSGYDSVYNNQYENYCEKNDCLRSSCINSKDLPMEVQDLKICVCCINFDYTQTKDNGRQEWKVKDYKINVFYQNNSQEKSRPYFSADLQKILLPTKSDEYIILSPTYSQPYYTKGYPEKIEVSLKKIKIDYSALFDFILSRFY